MQSNFHLPQIHFNLRPQIRVYSGEEIQFSGRRTRINEIPALGARSLGGDCWVVEEDYKYTHLTGAVALSAV